MRAGAAGAFRRVQARRAARPADPIAVLLGPQGANERVFQALGGRAAAVAGADHGQEGCLRAEALEGLVLVEPPEVLRDAAEVTELAIFLKGLQHAHGLVLAVHADGDPEGAGGPWGGAPLDALPLLLDFYGVPQGWQHFVAVAVVGVLSTDVEAAKALAHEALERHGVDTVGGCPEIFCMDNVAHARLLVERLRGRPPAPCDPLLSRSPLLESYRAIKEQLETLRAATPPAGGTASKASKAALSSPGGSPARFSPGASAADAASLGERGDGAPGPWTVMVFGRTGSGKSAIGNLLLGFPAFASADSLASVTSAQSVRRATSPDGSITVLDTIGFGDTRLPPKDVVHSLRDTALEAPGGIDLLLFVLKKERVTDSEKETLQYVTQILFGPECLPNLYLVVTHAGRLAKDVDLQGPWVGEQAGASPQFATILDTIGSSGPDVMQRVAFVENPDLSQAEDEQDRELAERRRQRAMYSLKALLERHRSRPFLHGIMARAGELQQARLEELKRELKEKVEAEVRQELDQDRGQLRQEREQLQAEVEQHRASLQVQEQEMKHRFEEEWLRMRTEFEQRARDMAKKDLQPLAEEIVTASEKKSKAEGRWCLVM